ncbi:MAG TPA: bifunctional phosphoglucose/phosphomannose isomerase [Candidatus Thermoplasmatota archaeon]|nr:bifunctional phosphoglucose/phosphomannose isomerase [Candidatus Thermoplasmatota archaeon]
MLDIPEEKVRAADPEDMLGRVRSYPDMIEAALAAAQPGGTLPRAPTRVLVVGMGGSAITGDYLQAWLDAEGGVPMLVSRAYELPKWVDRDTLVIAFSYSGNTEETLAAFADARKAGAMLAAMSTGNKLEELAKSYQAPFARIQGGLQPRAALPASFTTASLLLERLGLLKGAEGQMKRAARTLREAVVDIAPDVPASKNEAKRTALALQETVAGVYAAGLLAPTARRFANQLNENSKVLSWWGVMPEMNHNELVGWAGDDELDRFTAVFLRYQDEHAQAKARYDFTGRLIQQRGGRVVQHEARGETAPEKLLTASLVGDAVSVYLAALRNVDPTPVKVISELKAKVGETGFAAAIK